MTLERLSWLAPCLAAAVLGLLPESVDARARQWLVGAGLAVGVVATLATLVRTRRRALVGLGANLAVAAAVAAGMLGARAVRVEADSVRHASAAAGTEAPGWYGATPLAGGRLFILELDSASGLGQMLSQNFALPLRVFAVGVDNRRGEREVVVDLARAEILRRDGTSLAVPDRKQVLTSAKRGRDAILARHLTPYRVAPGATLGQGLLFLRAGLPSADVTGIVITIDGTPIRVEGRVLTMDEKRRSARPPAP